MSKRLGISVNLSQKFRNKLDEIKTKFDLAKDTDAVRLSIEMAHGQITKTIPKNDRQGLFQPERIQYFNEVLEDEYIKYAYGYRNLEEFLIGAAENNIIHYKIELATVKRITTFLNQYGRQNWLELFIQDTLLNWKGMRDKYGDYPNREAISSMISNHAEKIKIVTYIFGKIPEKEILELMENMLDSNKLIENENNILDVDDDFGYRRYTYETKLDGGLIPRPQYYFI